MFMLKNCMKKFSFLIKYLFIFNRTFHKNQKFQFKYFIWWIVRSWLYACTNDIELELHCKHTGSQAGRQSSNQQLSTPQKCKEQAKNYIHYLLTLFLNISIPQQHKATKKNLEWQAGRPGQLHYVGILL